MTNSYQIRFYPGITIYQALASTGNVRFGPSGQVIAVDGVAIGGGVNYALLLNGRRIPHSLINFPLQPNDVVALELFLSGVGPREDEATAPAFHNTQPGFPAAPSFGYGEYRQDEDLPTGNE
ncbi:hypothetical protein FHS18_004728 [Paenibacillus phyllosphaerae]|uniref:Uncharacterized protein n=1 Tax=Paenibacillus phyllosphaerae TaxID=274593 RepID=A0A7W5B1E7_9BACL|nr:hypothetical protein [Paenibacillus phyllosphaerae]MBB3112627.1 hypothetical protein [Paenibacillus phyllosphaerae]